MTTFNTTISQGGAVWPARWAHNPKVGGSNPSPATTLSLIKTIVRLSNTESLLSLGWLKFTHAYPFFNETLTKPIKAEFAGYWGEVAALRKHAKEIQRLGLIVLL